MRAGERVDTPASPKSSIPSVVMSKALFGVVVAGFCTRLVAADLFGGISVVVGAVVIGRRVVIAVVVVVELIAE